MATIDLEALLRHVDALPHDPLKISADDVAFPGPLRAFLAGTPNAGLSLDLSTGDGLSLSGDALTIAGASTDRWSIQGVLDAGIQLSAVKLAIGHDGTVTADVSGAMTLTPGRSVKVALTSPSAIAPWKLVLADDAAAITVTELLALAAFSAQFLEQPDGLNILDRALTVDKDGFAIWFAVAREGPPWFRYVFQVSMNDARWTPLPGILDFDGLDFSADMMARSLSARVVGHIQIGGVPIDVGVSLVGGAGLFAFVKPSHGDRFPGLAALADWALGGSDAGVGSGFSALHLPLDAVDLAISGADIVFDWRTRTLTSLRVMSVLTLKALAFDIVFRLPGREIVGGLRGGNPVQVRDLVASFGLDASDVPSELTIAQADLSASLSYASYQMAIAADDVWSIGPLGIEQVRCAIAFTPGDVVAVFHGLVAIAKVQVAVSAADPGAGEGWLFEGATQGDVPIAIGDLIADLGDRFRVAVPAPIASLAIADLAISYDTATRRFTFTCAGSFTVETVPVAMVVTVALGPRQAGPAQASGIPAAAGDAPGIGYAATYTGTLTLAGLVFQVAFDSVDTGAQTFVATYHRDPADPGTISLRDLVGALAPSLSNDIPVQLVIDLRDVKLVFTKRAGSDAFVLGLDLSAQLGLADLPLVGHKLPDAENLGIRDLQVLYASAPLAAPTVDIAGLNALLPDGVSKLPASGVPAGIRVGATLALGPTPQAIGVSPQPPASAPPPASPPQTMRQTGRYFDVQRQFGPVDIQRVGLLLDSDRLMFALDAALTVGPVGFTLEGLAIGSKLDAFSPAFDLSGIGVSFTQPALRILGGLMKLPASQLKTGVAFQYDGVVVVQAEQLGLAAVGSYAQYTDGAPALFVFAQLLAPLGGPPAFFVTGLMGGFGFNRALTIPGQDQVASFPLLALAAPPQAGQPPPTPLAILQTLEGEIPLTPGTSAVRWIVPELGQYWLAAGLNFTSFEILQSEALAIVEFGHDLEVALIGTSTLQLPQPVENALAPYVFVALQIRLVLEPQEGVFAASAILAPSSYVITPDCHLTGGFAFYMWFGASAHAGDLVVTLGGYHPAFRAPHYYPVVPRLGFNWRPSDAVVIHGDAYFALTPSCVMAGGALVVLYRSSDTRAWFTAHADFLMSWRPFFYTADIAVSIGVSYRLDLLFCSVSVSVSISASVNLWGPPTGGTARIDLSVISFSVDFGSDRTGASGKALVWADFKSLLPRDSHICRIAITGGLFKARDDAGQSSGKLWITRVTRLAFTTRSAIPASHLSINGDERWAKPSGAIAIKPMNLDAVRSVHAVSIRRADGTVAELTGWSVTPSVAGVPERLWGHPPASFSQTPNEPTAEIVPGAVLGCDIVVPGPMLGRSRGPIALGVFDEELVATGVTPIDPGAHPSRAYAPVEDATTVGAIATIAAPQIVQARGALVAALRAADLYAGADADMSRLAAAAQHLFAAPPMRCP